MSATGVKLLPRPALLWLVLSFCHNNMTHVRSSITNTSISPTSLWSVQSKQNLLVGQVFKNYEDSQLEKIIQADICNKQLSCKGRCGDNGSHPLSYCQCDSYCLFHNQCCWDFQTQCPAQVLGYQRRVSEIGHSHVTCIEGVAVIDSCGQGNVMEEKETDYREPIFTVDDKLHFINHNVYNCFFRGHDTSQHNIKYWHKVITFPNTTSSIRTLQNFALMGRKPESFEIRNTLPDDIGETLSRTCWKGYTFTCNFEVPIQGKTALLPVSNFVQTRDSLCNEEILQSSFSTTTSKTEAIDRTRNGLVNQRVSTLTLGTLKSPCLIIPKLSESSTLRMPAHAVARTEGDVQIIAHFKDIQNPVIVKTHALGPTFPNIVFKAEEKASVLLNNDYRPIGCKGNGFPLGFLCYRPLSISMKVYGLYNKLPILKRIIHDIIFVMVNNKEAPVILSQMWRDESKVKVEGDYVTLTNNLGNYYGSVAFDWTRLPFTNSVVKMLEDKAGLTSTSVRAISICSMMSPRPFDPQIRVKVEMVFCDHLVSTNKGIAFHSHARLDGHRFPDPIISRFFSKDKNIRPSVINNGVFHASPMKALVVIVSLLAVFGSIGNY